MANRFWVGGTGTWSTVLTTNWSATSGGAGGASVPTSSDTVIFNASSGGGTVTVSGSVVCGDLDMGAAAAMSFAVTGATISIGGAANGYVTLGASVTYSGGRYQLVSTSTNGGAGWPITSNGKAINGLTLNGVGGKWICADAINVLADITLTNGTFDSNNKNVQCVSLSSVNSNVRTLSMGSSAWTLTGGSNCWNTSTFTNLTTTTNTATITFTGAGASAFGGSGYNWNGASLIATGSGTFATANSVTCANFTRTGTAVATDALQINGSLTVTGTLTLTGNSISNRLLVKSITTGVALNLSAATVVLTNCDFRDINALGAAIPFSGTSIGNNQGNNANFTYTTPTSRYWVGGTGNWTDTTHWSASSGGASGATAPLCHDNVFLDSNSGTGTITMNQFRMGADINMTGYAGTFTTGTAGCEIQGSWTLGTSTTYSSGSSGPFFVGRGSHTINTNGRNPGNSYFFQTSGGTYTLQNNITYPAGGGNCQLNSGTLDFNGFNFTGGGWSINTAANKTMILGTGIISCAGTGTNCWNVSNATNTTLTAGSATIVLTDVSATAKSFVGGGLTYNDLQITGGGAGAITFGGANTFNTIQVLGGTKSLIFPAGVTTTFLNQTSFGNSTNVITFTSTTPTSQYTFSQSSGVVSADSLSLTDSAAAGGAVWHAGPNSTSVSNNTGWVFGGLSQSLNDTATSSDANAKSVGHPLSDSITSSDALAKLLTKLFADTTTESDATAKSIASPRADSVTAADSSATAAAYRRVIADSDITSDLLSATLVNGAVTIQEVAITLDSAGNSVAVSTPSNSGSIQAGGDDDLILSSPANNKTIQSSSNSAIIGNEVT